MTDNRFTESEAEAALCLWEHYLNRRLQGVGKPRFWEDNGASAMRLAMLSLCEECELAYETVRQQCPDVCDAMSFDWDFVPAWADFFVCDDTMTVSHNNGASIEAFIGELQARHQ